MLVDEIEVTFKAGDGGKGVVSFGKMEKSGPDGGNGGKGGDLYVEGSSDLTLLNQFLSKRNVAAEDGIDGGKDKMTGADGEDLHIKLPVGTLLTDKQSGDKYELTEVGQRLRLCIGGAGGIGNYDLRSSRNTTPEITISPEKGEVREFTLILRFIADFGLVGLPSAGKSSLLNELTNAKAKTAAYHFTTLSPNLGVLPNSPARAGKKILADIPGLIEGASQGKGLGIKFLKHIQKVDLLLHCISADSEHPLADYKTIRKELGEYSNDLLDKKEIIILTKSDVVDDKTLEKAKKSLRTTKRKIFVTSIHDIDSIDRLNTFLK